MPPSPRVRACRLTWRPGDPSVTLEPIHDEGGFLVFGQLPESLPIEVEPVAT